jgi:hypothetical protein
MPDYKDNRDDLGRVRATVRIGQRGDPKPVRFYGGGEMVPMIPTRSEPSPSFMLESARWEREARADRRDTLNLVFMAIMAFTGVAGLIIELQ